MIAIRLIACVLLMLSVGCASVPAPMAEYNKLSEEEKKIEKETTKQALERDFQEALKRMALTLADRTSQRGPG